MRIVAIFFVILGVALAGGALHFGNQYLKQQEAMMANQGPGVEMVNVIAAAVPLRYGDRISSQTTYNTLRFVQWPKSAVPEGAFYSEAELVGEARDQVRTVLRQIEPGELLLKAKVSGFGENVRVATQVAEGKRAFTIPIDAVSGVAGLIAPGDRVDILITRTIDRELKTSIILQNILVIATDQRSNTESSRARLASTATVEVDPKEAQKLALAQQVGKLTLTLRGVNEAVETDLSPVGMQDLPDQPAPVEVTQPAPEPVVVTPTVRVRKGGQVQEIEVDQ